MSQFPETSSDMPELNSEFIKRYQKLLQKVPTAPTADPKELSNLKAAVKQAKAILKEKDAELAERDRQRDQYKAQLESCTAQFESQTETIESLQETIDRLQIEVDNPPQQETPIAAEPAAADSAVNSLREENKELRSKTQKQTIKIEALESDHNGVWDANEAHRITIEEKTREIKELQAELAASSGVPAKDARGERKPVDGTKEELKAHIDKMRENISRLDRQYNGYGGLDLAKVPASRLGEVAAIFEQELETKQQRQAFVLRARNS